MKENTRFCTRSYSDHTRFGGTISFAEFSPYPNATTESKGSYYASKIGKDESFDEMCRRNIIQRNKLRNNNIPIKEVAEFVY